jgi:nicotinamidase-related amidase
VRPLQKGNDVSTSFEITCAADAEAAMRAVVDYNASLHRGKGSFMRRRLGFGARPGILVIDMANAWTKAGTPYQCDDMETIIPGTRQLLEAGRAKGIPIVFTTMAYVDPSGPNSDAGLMQHKFESTYFATGSEAVQIDERLGMRPDEQCIVKKHASAFHGTYLSGYLRAAGVDTLLVTGVTASACVRNSCEDAIAEGFRPIAVRELVGDRVPGVTYYNLFDIDAKFGDVESLTTVLEYLQAVP